MFKKGDKVYSILRGWGEVTRIYTDNGMVGVMFNGCYEVYEKDGKKQSNHLIPELYHTEPTITVPKRRVDHKGWIGVYPKVKGVDDKSRRNTYIFDNKEDFKQDDWLDGCTLQEITYYTEE